MLNKKRITLLVLLMIISVSNALGNYTGTYGKVDNLEIGFDMFLDFFIGVAPYIMYIAFALTVAWGLNKLLNWTSK